MIIPYKPEDLREQAELKALRSAVLHRIQKFGVDTTEWMYVNDFMRDPRVAGKSLGEMDIEELKSFIPKMSSILTKEMADRYAAGPKPKKIRRTQA
ncbi:MAG: hypothetical protein LBR08_10425 [Bacteroidales bacterium]|jgi:hypothetical protein|nr:hypothetical protein [Bacteroidales bacterium]